jgi:molybdenum cofactor cytidylyltransferase
MVVGLSVTSHYFALVPAAGHSSRMGQPKLLMPLAGQPLIAHTLAAWGRSDVDRIAVVVRPDDVALANVVRSVASKVDVVIPSQPPHDMKVSLQMALKHFEDGHAPTADDAFLVAPADMPRLSPAIVNRLIARHRTDANKTILVPTLLGSRGHPVLFPWSMAGEVFDLGSEEGLDAVVRRHTTVLVPCEDLVGHSEYPFTDIDTPDDYREMTHDR